MGGKGSGRWAKGSTGNRALPKHLTQEGVYFETTFYPPECFEDEGQTTCCDAWASVLMGMGVPLAFSPVHDRDYFDFMDFAEHPEPINQLYEVMCKLSDTEEIQSLNPDGVLYSFDNTEKNREYLLQLYEGFREHGKRYQLPSDMPWLPLILKKKHRHVIFKARAKCSVNSFVKSFSADDGKESPWELLGIDPLRDVRKVNNEMVFTRYLAHLDCKGIINKAQYDINGICAMNGYPLQKFLAGEDSDAQLFDEIIKVCLMHNFRSERALLEYVRKLSDKDMRNLWFAFIKKNLKMFSAYLHDFSVDNNGLPVSVMSDNISSGNTD